MYVFIQSIKSLVVTCQITIVYITIITIVSHSINNNHNTLYTILCLKININIEAVQTHILC